MNIPILKQVRQLNVENDRDLRTNIKKKQYFDLFYLIAQ